ncbi:class I SAM-dependent methyltransferase [Candidatus Kaiserbacteria bacterium]|nr:class I SAM-dependent methyltransferase [Candidatus Kaiserbacteria bacterium]
MKDLQKQRTEPLVRIPTQCRMCRKSTLVQYLDLGSHPPADQFRKTEELDLPEIAYPLRVMLCTTCGLSQLSHVVDPRVLYQFDYPYESGTTTSGKRHWDAFASAVVQRLRLRAGDLVVDVGSNDGTLLNSFAEAGMKVVGIDPAQNIVALANAKGIKTYCAFFGRAIADVVRKKHGSASVIVGTNVFAHIDDLHEVMASAKKLLTANGVFIFESPHFEHLVERLEYDTVYHEHLSYLSLTPVVSFVQQFGMEVFAVEETPIHGGSFRVYIGRKGKHTIDKNVAKILSTEKKKQLHVLKALQKFAERVTQNRHELMVLIEKLVHKGKKIALVSTPAKGMTLINFAGITLRHAPFATEKSALKIGRHTPGAHIPILSDSALLTEGAEYALLLAWNFADEIIKNNQAFRDRGGKFIIPIPKPIIK